MKKESVLLAGIAVLIGLVALQSVGWAAEHGGKEHAGTAPAAKEHGGQEHGGTAMQAPVVAVVEPTPEALRSSIKEYIEATVQEEGTFSIVDTETGQTRNLELVQVHERVGKTGNYYYSCTDMTDLDTGEMLDLDFDVSNDNGTLRVLPDKVRIHKVNGQPHYTYDENDNMIPVTAQKE
jgi:hypothetical protein